MYTYSNTNSDSFSSSFSNFKSVTDLSSIISRCGGRKIRGIPVMTVFTYLFSLAFKKKSMNLDQTFTEKQKKDTCHRFLAFDRIDWNSIITLVSIAIFKLFEPLRRKDCAGSKKPLCFVADDSSFYRNRSKRVELSGKCFDHASNCFYTGFRMLTLSLTDGISLLPLSFCNMSSSKEYRKREADYSKIKENSAGYKIKQMSEMSAPEALISMMKRAKELGVKPSYLLCDRWFSSPKTVFSFKDCGVDVISMLKDSSTKYIFRNRKMKMKDIFKTLVNEERLNRKIHHTSGKCDNQKKYIFCTDVIMEEKQDPKRQMKVRFVFVRNKNKASSFLCLMSTDTNLSAEQIIETYGNRWKIEILFKTAKSYLGLEKTTQSIDYLQINASTAILMIQYQMIAYQKRMNSDEASYGKLFEILVEEVSTEAMLKALENLLSMFAEEVVKEFGLPKEKIEQMVQEFMSCLNPDIKEKLLSA